jgi:hypothetical protein
MQDQMAESAPCVSELHERLNLPGAAANPDHLPARRLDDVAIVLLMGLMSGLGNSIIQVRLNFVQGAFALPSVEGAWPTATYYLTYVMGNLVLVVALLWVSIRLSKQRRCEPSTPLQLMKAQQALQQLGSGGA